MSTLQQLQQPIDLAIVNAMISSTPDEWSEIVLEIRGPKDRQPGALSLELSNPGGLAPIVPSDALYEATYALDTLLLSRDVKLERATYFATQCDTDWQWKAAYAYV